MFPRPLFRKLQRALGGLLRAEQRVDEARQELDELEALVARSRDRMTTAELSLRDARLSWDDELEALATENPEWSDRLPGKTSSPGFRADRVQLEVGRVA